MTVRTAGASRWCSGTLCDTSGSRSRTSAEAVSPKVSPALTRCRPIDADQSRFPTHLSTASRSTPNPAEMPRHRPATFQDVIAIAQGLAVIIPDLVGVTTDKIVVNASAERVAAAVEAQLEQLRAEEPPAP